MVAFETMNPSQARDCAPREHAQVTADLGYPGAMGDRSTQLCSRKLRWASGVGLGLLVLWGCSDDVDRTSGTGGATTGTTRTGTTPAGTTPTGTTTTGTGIDPGSCDPDPLWTGLVAEQTGVSVDAFDCPILEHAAALGMPDPMIIKAMIYVESRFQFDAVACPNLPCGIPAGWTEEECYCFGLMQIVASCGGTPNNLGLLPNGHPNLTTDSSSPDWPNSIFNPTVNIEIGTTWVTDNRARFQAQFPGCTDDQYTLMAIGDYNSYGSTQSCTVYNFQYVDHVLEAYREYSTAAGWPAHPY